MILPRCAGRPASARDEVITAHTGQQWTVAYCGFAPGFGYLVGEDDRLRVSRRADPRTTVPAGAVGLAGSFSGIYPREGPGGWQLNRPDRGVRNYLAIRGGIKIAKTLGSRSYDVLSGLGPPPLAAGQELEVGRTSRPLPNVEVAPPLQPRKTLDLSAGPRQDWFSARAWTDLITAASGWPRRIRIGWPCASPAHH